MSDTTSKIARRTYFIDSENHINTCLQGIETLGADDLVLVFHRESNLSQKQKSSIRDSKAQVEWILCQDSGVKNSLDVQLIAELSRRIACHEIENGYIISQDQGYRPAIHYLLNRYAEDFRFIGLKRSIDEFLLTDALISSESRQDVHAALVHTAGQIIGTAMYRHIRDVFDESSATDEPVGGFTVVGAPNVTDPALVSGGEGVEATATERVLRDGTPESGASAGSARRSSKRRKPRAAVPAATPAETAAEHVDSVSEHVEATPQHVERAPGAPASFEEPSGTEAPAASPTSAHPTSHTSPVRPGQKSSASARRRSKAPRSAESITVAESVERETPAPAAAPSVKKKAVVPQKSGATGNETKQNGAKPDKQQNLTSLTNIGLALAKRLEACGINTPDALRDIGSREAWRLLKEQSSSASISWLYALEGAIRDIAVKDLDEENRLELKAFCKQVS